MLLEKDSKSKPSAQVVWRVSGRRDGTIGRDSEDLGKRSILIGRGGQAEPTSVKETEAEPHDEGFPAAVGRGLSIGVPTTDSSAVGADLELWPPLRSGGSAPSRWRTKKFWSRR